MVFKCQEDSFLKEFTAKVISCEEVSKNIIINGKKTNFNGFEVVLENTILFPEGGGQPSDTGYLNQSKVCYVARKGDIAIHYVDEPLKVGENVTQKIDWNKREDHMQQHSGQHLISAIFERKYGLQTVSWWLGEETSYIELDTPSVSDELLIAVENEVNELIQQARKVDVIVYNKDTPAEVLQEAKSNRGLPDDHVGDIRVISIDGIDNNMCCGTHVNNLSQLQAIKLLNSEKSKRLNKTFVHFLCGKRVLKRLDDCLKREQKLTVLLKNNPVQHPELVEKLLKNIKNVSKNLSTVLKDLAIHEVMKLKNADPTPKYYSLHRKEAEPDFMNVFIQEYGKTDVLLFLSTGEEKGVGNIVLYGPEDDVQKLGPRICSLMDGKGAGKGNKFQAKVTKMENRSKAEQVVKEHFS
ncbi:alanyl-tRNA editing protein Aarsd1-B [Coccinella septempunctata]|uniref:alanyl-tRNA editing protein Aarsd1-B n=1 Tax=Coccinella septempunctata TaxID=41139 RepID=UPI001D07405B|nr:alanyl-tRNA editing protein Aarsd1-B [Coccinella septempunctata]